MRWLVFSAYHVLACVFGTIHMRIQPSIYMYVVQHACKLLSYFFFFFIFFFSFSIRQRKKTEIKTPKRLYILRCRRRWLAVAAVAMKWKTRKEWRPSECAMCGNYSAFTFLLHEHFAFFFFLFISFSSFLWTFSLVRLCIRYFLFIILIRLLL